MDVTSTIQHTADERRQLRRRLLAWYRKHRRALPWRESRDPYRVWVSEIMLQQTQVATVRDYFDRFLRAFPDVEALAAADEAAVLRQWEGLGYYRRARQLHAAAREIVSSHSGQFPRDAEALAELPGIGRYTAGAIASIAFGARAPIVEANTARLFARLTGFCGAITPSSGQRFLWKTAESLLPKKGADQFNQALMELGSLVCKPDAPRCDACPVMRWCGAHQQGLVSRIPRKRRRQKTIAVREAAVLVVRRGRVLLRRCGDDERWAGLWDFPRFECQDGESGNGRASDPDAPSVRVAENARRRAHPQTALTITSAVRNQTGVTICPGELVKTIRHAVTRYRITLDCYTAEYVAGRPRSTRNRPVKWVLHRELDDYPLSRTGREMTELI